jgi:ferredoxin
MRVGVSVAAPLRCPPPACDRTLCATQRLGLAPTSFERGGPFSISKGGVLLWQGEGGCFWGGTASFGTVGQKDKVLSVKCYERQIVRRTIKNCPTDNLKLSEKNRQRDNSLQPVVSKRGCETAKKVLSVKGYERQIVRRTIKNCPTDNLKLSIGQKDKVLSVKCYERQIVRRTIKNCPTDNLKLSEKNRQRDNSLQPVVSKSGCETSNKVLSVKRYERQIVRKTIKNCPTDNLKLSVGQKDKVLSVKCYERQIVRRTIKNCPTDNLKLSEKNRQRDNSLQPVVSKSGCETSNKVLSVKCYERQIVRRTIKNCSTDNLKLSDGQFKIVRQTKG